ncbi:hypothetical protein [Comamonas thiooxydans]|uniref:hypothetical protein n=1 Tax=Comamonas thiooxydans TaxID=363952 RepID=UPI0007C491D5|nr:hypothetical protein [Comamonas thiooxydans]
MSTTAFPKLASDAPHVPTWADHRIAMRKGIVLYIRAFLPALTGMLGLAIASNPPRPGCVTNQLHNTTT